MTRERGVAGSNSVASYLVTAHTQYPAFNVVAILACLIPQDLLLLLGNCLTLTDDCPPAHHRAQNSARARGSCPLLHQNHIPKVRWRNLITFSHGARCSLKYPFSCAAEVGKVCGCTQYQPLVRGPPSQGPRKALHQKHLPRRMMYNQKHLSPIMTLVTRQPLQLSLPHRQRALSAFLGGLLHVSRHDGNRKSRLRKLPRAFPSRQIQRHIVDGRVCAAKHVAGSA